MSRIIAGFAKGRKLLSPAKNTRPTTDRIKESMFGILQSQEVIESASVLDIFAGTGAVGLEAISRGATKLVMVEKDATAASICQQNAELVLSHLETPADIQMLQANAYNALDNLVGQFDLIFLDPPYNYPIKKLNENLQQLLPLAKGVVVVEKSAKTEMPDLTGWVLAETKNYGDSELVFLTKDVSH